MKTEKELQKIGEDVVRVICEIYDPEIPVNIYALGLIYDVQVSDECDVKIIMTLTSPNCPVAESLPVEIEEKVKSLNDVKNVKVEIVFEPPWSKEMMSEEAKLELECCNMTEEIINKVAKSGLITIDLSDFSKGVLIDEFDIKKFLFGGGFKRKRF